MNGRKRFLLVVIIVPLLGSCSFTQNRGQNPRAQNSPVPRAAAPAAAEYAEINYVKLLAAPADELANSLVKVRCSFASVHSLLPPRYSSVSYLAINVLGPNMRPTTQARMVVPKRLAESAVALSAGDQIVVFGKVVAVPLSGWSQLPGGMSGRTVELVLEVHKIESATSAEVEQEKRAQAIELTRRLLQGAQTPQESRPDAVSNQPQLASPVAVGPPANLSGVFSGEITGIANGREYSLQATITLTQNGDQVIGVWVTTGGGSGTLDGNLKGQLISGSKVKQTNPCEGQFAGAAVIQNDGVRLRGTYVGADCGGIAKITFVVDRQ